jgi:hypothetical protein
MKTENLERYLDSFGKYVVQQSRTNLTKGKKNVDKTLYNSIKFEVSTSTDGLSIQFYMADYGAFVDKGVSGTKKQRSFKNWEGKDVPSPYKYKSKQPPAGIIEKWIKKRGLKGRVDKNWKSAGNRGGQFITDKSFAFLVARKIKLKGIKGISFFQRPIMLGLKKFMPEILKGLKDDILEELKQVK